MDLREIQLRALLTGLDCPQQEFWLNQPPEAFLHLGKAISGQAKRAPDATPIDEIEYFGKLIAMYAKPTAPASD